MISLGALNDIRGLRHGFFTRRGGVSEGLYASMNCGFGSDDDPELVKENRRRVAQRIGVKPERLVTAHQTHSTKVATVEAPWLVADAPEADALVTRESGVGIGILTADCAAVLFADANAKVIGAAHAGWRGAKDGVLEATVNAMEALGATRKSIIAGTGPRIAMRSYEVGPDFPADFLAEDPGNGDFFAPAEKAGHHRFDLGGYIGRRLGRIGVDFIHVCPHDTYVEADRFFSYRRSVHRGEPDYGRNLAVITLED